MSRRIIRVDGTEEPLATPQSIAQINQLARS